jgi:glutamine synthetase
MHVHASLADVDGKNVFAGDGGPVTGPLAHAIGGLLETMRESMAIFAPNANSYRRFRANSYAPVAPTWGVNNRTVSFRVPAGAPPTRHIEHRVAGADAHPTLALAALLAAVHHGISTKIDPGPAIVGDGYAQAAEGGERIPTNWFAATDRFADSAILKDYLGERFVRMYTTVKRTEQDRFQSVITDIDYDWYLSAC